MSIKTSQKRVFSCYVFYNFIPLNVNNAYKEFKALLQLNQSCSFVAVKLPRKKNAISLRETQNYKIHKSCKLHKIFHSSVQKLQHLFQLPTLQTIQIIHFETTPVNDIDRVY